MVTVALFRQWLESDPHRQELHVAIQRADEVGDRGMTLLLEGLLLVREYDERW